MLSSVSALGDDARVVLVDGYGDGTFWASFEDSEGRWATVCIDGRKGSPTRNRLFDRARHPRKPEAVLIELGAPEEGIVVPLISRWLDSDGPRNLGLREEGKEFVQAALLRLGEPTAKSGSLTLEIILPLFLEDSSRQTVVDRLEVALESERLGHITGGGRGFGITDIFVEVADVPASLRVVRDILGNYLWAQGAAVKQYEPFKMVFQLQQ
jgi:hypothetical protein